MLFNTIKYGLSLVVAAVVATLLFSCESNFKEVQKINSVSFTPTGEADTLNLKYTDSGKVKAILESPKMLDYGTLKYPFTEFPKGVHVTLYDDQNQKSYVDANYAISYAKTNIIDLQGNVRITSSDGKLLQTEQLYYDQKNEWFFTEKHFKYTDAAGGYLEGPGVDFSKDFKVFNMQNSSGQVTKLN
ncbi:LPS export ABC transporter periplasmic protein LptC [Flavobacterium sp. SM15]|uniref:LPS export ABC transporter periplasmic protein LptC n=1 Tax=Flavobacterium sp. SM15 TaxID=2908005 RepID=UPI001EDAB0E2|nr:LPS export ABC transporter periplasmic protein LptC [Flavobacterium sp. SM15]MCG2609981.1 LPS export ABC transporter periplasmic protein LptC [Flavobacterium sp. SM15]